MSGYDFIYGVFKVASGIFYSTFDVRGVENIPKDDEPVLLLFNHGNSLGDPVVLMSTFPRRISFCAKDSLWSIPVVSTMITMSGAIPVYRPKEHGEKAKEFNTSTFAAVYKGLLNEKKCIAFAPEGISSFMSHASKFKSGVGFIAIETVLRARDRGDENFTVALQPAIMAWTHREKFRSDVLVRYEEPLRVNMKLLKEINPKAGELKQDEISEVKKFIAKELIDRVETVFKRNMISSPEWDTIKMAITALRIHRPLGTFLPLSTYFHLLFGWVQMLKHRRALIGYVPAKPDVSEGLKLDYSKEELDIIDKTFAQLELYQKLIDGVKVKDERFRRLKSDARIGLFATILAVIYRVGLSTVLGLACIPGLLIWSPIWYIILRKERSLLSQGRGWVDSIAEYKMLYGAFCLAGLLILMTILPISIPLSGYLIAPTIMGTLLLTMRLYEEFVANTRSIFGIVRLYLMSVEERNVVIAERKLAKDLVTKCLPLFPAVTAEAIIKETGEDVREMKDTGDVIRPGFWVNFNPFRRQKKDWNEVLRLSDYCTMDYLE